MQGKHSGESNTCLSATAEIVAAYLLNHKANLQEVEQVIELVYETLQRISGERATAALGQGMNVRVDESVTPEYIVCLEDGKKLKMLKRYLKTNYNMTPEEYRKRWGLPATYPMVAPDYAKKRSQLAKAIGLGKKPGAPKAKLNASKKAANARLRFVRTSPGSLAQAG